MKTLVVALLLTLAVSVSSAADQVPLFNAMLTLGKEHRFVLVNAIGKSSSFLRLGEAFEGYRLKSYDAKTGELELEKNGKAVRVGLVAEAATTNAPLPGTRATIADAEQALNAMNFEAMMDKLLEGTKRGQMRMLDQVIGQFGETDAEGNAMGELQKRMLDELINALSGSELKSDMARIYSEAFTKEELQGLATFYKTDLGQKLNEKTPEVQEKLNAVLMPRILAAIPRAQAVAREFAEQQRAKREAAASGDAGGKK